MREEHFSNADLDIENAWPDDAMGILQVKIASTLQIVILIYTVIPLLKLV
jgi:hypothetical protein